MDDTAVSDIERSAVKSLCAALGPTQAAKRLGLNITSLLRVVARQTVRRGTVALLRQALATLNETKP